LVLLLRTIGGNVLVDPVVPNPAAKPAVHAVWGTSTSLLKSIATSTIAFGLLVFLAAWPACPTGIATALRREAAPYVRAHWAVAYGAAAAIFLILVAWAPVQILSESPDAAALHRGGDLSDGEYSTAKAELLGGGPAAPGLAPDGASGPA
jgi:hypothetical protein